MAFVVFAYFLSFIIFQTKYLLSYIICIHQFLFSYYISFRPHKSWLCPCLKTPLSISCMHVCYREHCRKTFTMKQDLPGHDVVQNSDGAKLTLYLSEYISAPKYQQQPLLLPGNGIIGTFQLLSCWSSVNITEHHDWSTVHKPSCLLLWSTENYD